MTHSQKVMSIFELGTLFSFCIFIHKMYVSGSVSILWVELGTLFSFCIFIHKMYVSGSVSILWVEEIYSKNN